MARLANGGFFLLRLSSGDKVVRCWRAGLVSDLRGERERAAKSKKENSFFLGGGISRGKGAEEIKQAGRVGTRDEKPWH